MKAHTGRRSSGSRAAVGTLTPVETGMLLAVIVTLVAAAILSATPRPSDLATTTIRVDAGDSLWEIAREHPVDGLTTGETVDLLAEVNDLESATIAVGASLKVPAEPSPNAVAMR